MANRQIGWSQESNLLWQIGNQIERLTGVTSKISGGSSTTIVVTKTEIDALIASSSLVPGNVYIISGVDVPLYGGTTIMLQAATTNELALAGHGVFYNPKYLNSQLTPNNGYGVWSNYIFLIFDNVVGFFTKGQTVTANNGATAIYLGEFFVSWISGDWSTATTMSNGSGTTADVISGVSPSYAIGQDVIWGGKHWTNISGNVGTAVDKYTLSGADWSVVPFNSTDYNVEIDVIHYDYLHDVIIRRKDRWDNDVDGDYQWFLEVSSPDGYGYGGNPIKDFQWGNGNDDFNTDDYNYIGVQSNYVKDSYLECINFIGSYLWLNTLTQRSVMYNNITDVTSFIHVNTLTYSGIENNILNNNSQIIDNVLINNTSIINNTVQDSFIYGNTLDNSRIETNVINNNSYIRDNIQVNSNINNNKLNASIINTNKLTVGNIQNNTLISSRIIVNTLDNFSRIDGNVLTTLGIIEGNSLNNSVIQNNILTNFSYIRNNTLTNSAFDFSPSGTLTTKNIQFIIATNNNATFNISTATIIYGDYSKQMFKNSAGTTRLGYYNGSDVFTVVNVNA